MPQDQWVKEKNINAKVTFLPTPVKPIQMFLAHPYPLDLSIAKYCFMGCPYCFTNLNKKANKDTLGEIEDSTDIFLKKLQKANSPGYDPEDFVEYCLHHKYPIAYSNNNEPFMPALEHKYKSGERILRACLEYGQRLYIQTKMVYPNDTVKDLIIAGKDIFQVYCTITSLDDEKSLKGDATQTSATERFEKIEQLTSKGVHAVVACNPYIDELAGPLDKFFKRAKEAGFNGCYIYPLHFTKKQYKEVPESFPYKEKGGESGYDDFDLILPDIKKIAESMNFNLAYHHDASTWGPYYKGNSRFKSEEMWPIDACRLLWQAYKTQIENDSPVLIEWKMVDFFFSQYPVWDHVFNTTAFDNALCNSTEMHRMFRQTIGKRNKLKNIARFIFNYPHEFETDFIHHDRHVHLLTDTDPDDPKDYVFCEDDDDNFVYIFDYNKPGEYLYPQTELEEDLVELYDDEEIANNVERTSNIGFDAKPIYKEIIE